LIGGLYRQSYQKFHYFKICFGRSFKHASLKRFTLEKMELDFYSDEHFMREALKEAQRAFDEDEVPVGAVIVCNKKIIARAYNMTERLNDVTAHAEMQAFTSAANFLGGKYLDECTLYVTIEPCVMCAGASYWTQLSKIVYGAKDEKKGFQMMSKKILHPKTVLVGGVLEKECGLLMKEFFRKKR
jgi:tRNA(adenine34) deaminase